MYRTAAQAQLHTAAGANLALGVASALPAAAEQSHADFNGSCRACSRAPAELFALRRLLADADEQAIGRIEGGHFAGIPLDYAALDTRYPYQVGVLQARVEEILESRLAELGGELRRDWRLTGFEQDDEGVTVHGPQMLRARYLVGCDGGRSTVRRLLGVGVPRHRCHSVEHGRRHRARPGHRATADRVDIDGPSAGPFPATESSHF